MADKEEVTPTATAAMVARAVGKHTTDVPAAMVAITAKVAPAEMVEADVGAGPAVEVS